uniref:Uncharacterized protein n=1 Tax=Anguilla anguilla TaxID=7936 RepID=A0A0E9TKT8_ANGAN
MQDHNTKQQWRR